MAKVTEYNNGELAQRPVPPAVPKMRDLNVFEWLKLDNLRNSVSNHDDLIREMMTRQDRQAKWILFLLVSWVFSGVALALAMMAGH